MQFFAPKRIVLRGAEIHVHYANNAGRGTDNVTVSVVQRATPRPTQIRHYNDDRIITQYNTAGWRGHVDISNTMLAQYGPIHTVEN